MTDRRAWVKCQHCAGEGWYEGPPMQVGDDEWEQTQIECQCQGGWRAVEFKENIMPVPIKPKNPDGGGSGGSADEPVAPAPIPKPSTDPKDPDA